jgi:hypothetical protein
MSRSTHRVLALAGIVLAVLISTSSPAPSAPGVARPAAKPWPKTARAAIALVRADPDTSREASPFKREITWIAEWHRDRWWVIGLFESNWGVRFVVDATISHHHVYTYIEYISRPSRKWVLAKARRWHLATLYTRLTSTQAIEFAKTSIGLAPRYTIVDAAAKLARDTASSVGWYFVFYVTTQDGRKLVLAVTGLGGRPAEEGEYTSGYGFGSQPQLQDSVPLNLSDWVRSVVKARGWQPSNLGANAR